jgi:hypothetical protein
MAFRFSPLNGFMVVLTAHTVFGAGHLRVLSTLQSIGRLQHSASELSSRESIPISSSIERPISAPSFLTGQ